MEEYEFRSGCALSSALDLIGDKWSMLVLRGLFVGFSRFRDFLSAPERIATNILSDRLKKLECNGLIAKRNVRGSHESAYSLTEAGADLLPVLQALAAWSHAHLPDRWEPPESFMIASPRDFYPQGKNGRAAATTS